MENWFERPNEPETEGKPGVDWGILAFSDGPPEVRIVSEMWRSDITMFFHCSEQHLSWGLLHVKRRFNLEFRYARLGNN